ncbi:hypothetical protein [Nocardiopsis sp. CA-288880]|uniref:hypothetical protein n=1 Tax=Nocardiopsis sp. CA-288880 TaxID=3239995 RepID=UPI003D98DF3E
MINQPTDPQQIRELMQELTDILVEAGFKAATPVGAPKPPIGGRARTNGLWIEFCPDGGSTEESPRPEGYRGEFRVHDIRQGKVDSFSSRKNIKRCKQALKKSGWHCDHSLDNPLRTLPMSMHEEQHLVTRWIREKQLQEIRGAKKRVRRAELPFELADGLRAEWDPEFESKAQRVGIASEESRGTVKSKKAGQLIAVKVTLHDGSWNNRWDVVPSGGGEPERCYDFDEAVAAFRALG